jgi:RNA polymerase sigma-70 factor, ECF subfamily
VQAWESDDVTGLVALLKKDATLSMPPSWFWGREAIRAVLTSTVFGSVPKKWRLFPTQANAQPAFALYRADESSSYYQAFGIQVVTLDTTAPTGQIAEVIIFNVPSLVTSFGFPFQWPE